MSAESPRLGAEADTNADAAEDPGADGRVFTPLPGEMGIPNIAAPRRQSISRKGLLAVVLLVGSLLVASVLAVQRLSASITGAAADDGRTGRDKPAAAAAEPRKLDLAGASAAPGSAAPAPRIPALVPTDEELATPIGVRRTGASAPASSGARGMAPEDAPVLLVSSRPGQASTVVALPQTNEGGASVDGGNVEGGPSDPLASTARNLQGYQRQLQGLLDNLTRTADLARHETALPAVPIGATPGTTPGPAFGTTHGMPTPAGLLGGQLPSSTTPKATASMLGNRSLTLPKGTAFTCALKSRVVTASSGLVGCMVQRNVYGDDGRVLLIERGSHLDGEYRVTTVRPGMVRIPVLWTRVRTPLGVTVDIDSPATGQLGESGIEGHVDNRWSERIGAATLLSLIDDSVKLVIQQQSNDRQGDTIVLPSTTSNSSKLAEKVLDSTINIPPLIYQNQGGIVGIYVARDVDFSGVYELLPTNLRPDRP